MSQHDWNLANAPGATFRADLNALAESIATKSSGASAPSTTFQFQWWADTNTGLLKIRNAANSAWITVGTLASANLALLALSGGTLTGALITAASASGGAGFRLPHGAAPSSPVNGDLWTTTAALVARINGATHTMLRSGGALGIPASGDLANCTNLPPAGVNGLGALATEDSVGQGQLNTTTGQVFTLNEVTLLTLPGGQYGFYPQIRVDATGSELQQFSLGGISVFSATQFGTTLLTRIALGGEAGGSNTVAVQRYIQASPPYDLGDGEVPLFVFLVVNSSGVIESGYVAEDPPWANNGPTDIRPTVMRNGKAFQLQRPKAVMARLADAGTRDAELARLRQPPVEIEITQALKQADMPIIPHPFQGNDLTGKTVVLLDPVGALVLDLNELQKSGESVGSLIHDGYVAIDNVPLARAAPPGVQTARAVWKRT